MKYTYEINSQGKTINVTITGDLEAKGLAALSLKIMMKAKDQNCKIIFDCKHSKNKISIAEAYYWYVTHYDPVDIKLRYIPIAYIANEEDWDFYSFFGCTCRNRGIQVKAFQIKNAALKWIESL